MSTLNDMQIPGPEQIKQAVEGLRRKYWLATELLTEKQLAEAIRQALASGDFIRHVRVDNAAQQVVYVPYAEVEQLRAENIRIQEQLEEAETFLLNLGYERCPRSEVDSPSYYKPGQKP